MTYRGSTFIPEKEFVQYQQRKLQAHVATLDLPSEALRVPAEQERLDEYVASVTLPSQALEQQFAQAELDDYVKSRPLPSQELAQQFAEEDAQDLAGVATAGEGSSSPSSPEALPADPQSAAAGAPTDKHDPVQATLAYLGKLRGEMKERGLPEPDRQGPDQPPMPPAALMNTPLGPAVGRFPVAPVPPKPVPPSEEEQARVLAGEPFTPETMASELGKFMNAQGGGMQPAAGPLDALGIAGEQAVRREVAEGGASLARRNVLPGVKAAGEVAGDTSGGGALGQTRRVLKNLERNFLREDVLAPLDDPRPRGWSDPGLPNVKSVVQQHLGEIVPADRGLFHETSVPSARSIITRVEQGPRTQAGIFAADDADIALGQGGRGVTLEFDPQMVNGARGQNPAKALGEIAGVHEYRITKSVKGAVRAIVGGEREVAALQRDPLIAARFDFDAAEPVGGGIRVPRRPFRSEAPHEGVTFPQPLGAFAGIEPEYDDQGQVSGVRFSPEKAALGVAVGRLANRGGNAGGAAGGRPGVIYHDEIVLPKGPGEFKKYWDRSRNVLGAMGEAGKELAQRVHAWRDGWKDTAGDWATRMPDVWKLSKNEFENLVDVLEGAAKPVNARVAEAQTQAKAVLDDVYALAQNAGVEVAGRIEDYFPHRFDESFASQLRDNRRRAEIAQELLDTGQAATVDEAKAMMQRFVQASRDRRHGSLEMERLANIGGYQKTKDALVGHLVSAAKRIHEVAQFGKDDAIVNRLFGDLESAGYDARDLASARDLFQVIVNAKDYEGAPLPGLASGLRKYNAITRLGWAGVANATQGVNTATVTGVLRTLQSVPKAIWSAEDKEFALRAGVTLDHVLKELRSNEGMIGERFGKVAMPFFAEIEKFNRTLTAIAGRDFAIEQARKAAEGNRTARRALTALGLDADAVVRRGGKLDASELRSAARNIDERTQFQVDPQDLPGWANSPWGKVVTQFGTFSYNQSAFVGREVIGKALEGDVRPLVRFAILAPIAQAAATEVRNLGQGRDPEESTAKRAAQYVLGPLGKVGDAARAVLPINSDRLPVERQAAMLVGQALGPSVGGMTDLAGAGINVLRGNLVPAGRTALRQIPVVGTTLQNYVLPYEKREPTAPASDRDRGGAGRSSDRRR